MSETLEELTTATKLKVAALQPDLRGVVAFALKDLGHIRIDAKARPPVVDNGDEAQCTMAMTPDLFRKIMEGKADATTSFMLGKIKVTGDLGLAMKVPDWLEG